MIPRRSMNNTSNSPCCINCESKIHQLPYEGKYIDNQNTDYYNANFKGNGKRN